MLFQPHFFVFLLLFSVPQLVNNLLPFLQHFQFFIRSHYLGHIS
nr:MAG TPA: hypothetical protein [Caudoviricetes sp.]